MSNKQTGLSPVNVVPAIAGAGAALTVLDQNDGGCLDVAVGHQVLASYHFDAGAPVEEAPKPYFHPMRALNGTVVSVFRPADHRWHKGLQMTWSDVSGQNFWGGPTFDPTAPGHGYVWRQNIGRQAHQSFTAVDEGGSELRIIETLSWLTMAGEQWLDEERRIRFFGVDRDAGIWALDLDSTLTNVSASTLELGSPTTLGRPDAGYTGLFWRGPRSWTGSPFIVAGRGERESVMGETAEWVAIGGEADEHDGSATLLMFEARTSAGAPSTWFARSEPFASLSPSPAFHTVISLAPNESLSLTHRVVVINGRPDFGALTEIAERYRR